MIDIIIFGLIGGAILNLMPCCLPVLSIKILSFLKWGKGDKVLIRNQGIAYFLGNLATFLALAAIVIGAKALGTAMVWGFHLMNPWFCGFLALLFAFMGLGSIGILPWADRLTTGLEMRSTGTLGVSFCQGALSAIMGSACTGPFLGAAIGTGLALSWPYTLAMFASIGLGMGLPYLLLSLFPKGLKWLPKPGKWMVWVKKGSGIIMLLTALWLGSLCF